MSFYQKKIALSMIFAVFLVSAGISKTPDNSNDVTRSIVKVITHYIKPNYSSPWKMSTQSSRSGSGVIIAGNLILTNAHVVSNATYIVIKKENDPKIYEAKVVQIGHECDLALLAVLNKQFFNDANPVKLGSIPPLRTKVTTFGYPTGGNRISITEGVVSRIEIGFYSHSSKTKLLRIQTDAALNPGNSGGPVIQNNRIVGIAFQVNANADNIGYMIPVPVITHFLIDVKDGKYDGFPDLGIFTEDLHSKTYREYLSLKNGQNGILVTNIISGSSAYGFLKEGDVITEIDGNPIANDSSIKTPFGRLRYSFIIDIKQLGDIVKMKVFRNKKISEISFPVKKFPERIRWYNEYETRPEYIIFAGIVFQPLSREYLKTWNKWWLNADSRMLYYFNYHLTDNIHSERKEFITINNILPDEVNTYISDIHDVVVSRINGKPITCLKDVLEAFNKPKGKFHIINIDGTDIPILIQAKGLDKANKRIKERYNIPSLMRIYK